MTSWLRFSLLLTALLAHASPALACSFPACQGPVRLFGNDALVPGNLVYFAVRDEPATLTLKTAAGAQIPASVRTIGGDRVFAPDAPIAAGTSVRLEWTYDCKESSELALDSGSYEFRTVAAADLVVEPVDLTLVETGVATKGVPDFTTPFAYARVTYSNLPYPHLVDQTFTIDGKPTFADPRTAGATSTLTVHSPCEALPRAADSCGTTREFSLGRHEVQVTTTVIGASTQPPLAKLEVTTSCLVASDAGTDAGTHTVADAAGLDAGRDAGRRDATVRPSGNDDLDETVLVEKDDGCRLAGGRGDGAWALMLLALLYRRGRRANSGA